MADATETLPELTESPTEESHDKYPGGYKIAVELQEFLEADIANGKTRPLDRAALARAWCCLEETKRVLKMRPKPADMPVDPAALLKALKRAKVRAGGQGSIQRLLKEAEPIIESEPDEPPAHT